MVSRVDADRALFAALGRAYLDGQRLPYGTPSDSQTDPVDVLRERYRRKVAARGQTLALPTPRLSPDGLTVRRHGTSHGTARGVEFGRERFMLARQAELDAIKAGRF